MADSEKSFVEIVAVVFRMFSTSDYFELMQAWMRKVCDCTCMICFLDFLFSCGVVLLLLLWCSDSA